MKRFQKILFLLILIMGPVTWGHTQPISLQWSSPEKIKYQRKKPAGVESLQRLAFTNASYPTSERIPVFSRILSFNQQIRVTNCIWKNLSPTERYILLNYGPDIPDTLKWQVQSFKAAGEIKTRLTLFPFRKDPQTQQLQKLLSFTIEPKSGKDLPKQTLVKKFKELNKEPLSQGSWWKLSIPESGIYKITYEQLQEQGISSPEKVALFSHFSGQLPVDNASADDSLTRLPIKFYKGSDNVFNEGDYLLFYAKGAEFWQYNAASDMIEKKKHLYAEKNFVFLTNNGSIHPIAEQTTRTKYNRQKTTYLRPFLEETDRENLLESGQLWVGDLFDATKSRNYTFSTPGMLQGEEAKIALSVVARASTQSSFTLSTSDGWEQKIDLMGVNLSSQTGIQATQQTNSYSYPLANKEQITFTLTYNQPQSSDIGWLNYLLINIPATLHYNQQPLAWTDTESSNDTIKWEINTSNSAVQVWDVTNPYQPRQMAIQRASNKLSFICTSTPLPQSFIAFDPSEVAEVNWEETIPNQSIRTENAAELLIITHPEFLPQASRLAKAHSTYNNLTSRVVTTTSIYNAYTAGKPDAAALRNFIRESYQQQGHPLKYVLLFGDGSYDNKSLSQENTNLIPTYQSIESLVPTQSFVSDDFYGLLDVDENIENYPSGMLDIGIGRFPVSSTEEAALVVDKSIQYLQPAYSDSWQQRICFVGDDEDNNIHMRDADRLASFVDTTHPYIQIKKLYLDAFNQESSLVNESYPEVTRQIAEQINNGILLFNYTGHGGETGLAHERVVTLDDINSWNNRERLALFMTATCEFSRFDDYRITSAGEQVLLNPKGGAVALLTTTRLVYSSPNYELNRKFYNHFFTREEGQPLKLGEVFRRTKVDAGTGNNKRNFTLLGDPALPVPIPGYEIYTDSINGVPIEDHSDTLKALSKVTITGHVKTPSGIHANEYTGTLTATILDKPQQVTTLSNDGGSPFSFEARLSPIYKGEASIEEGSFRFSFIIPKDIILTPGEGRILYFSKSEEHQLGKGATEGIIIGGVASTQQTDNQGPSIDLFMNDTTFRNGGITNESPKLLAHLSDKNGINALGNGIGHDITAWLNGDTQHPIILNTYFKAEKDSYQQGTLEYQLPQLPQGTHHLKLKAWDSFNNSSEQSISFRVAEQQGITTGEVYNYPNPFRHETAFIFEHNAPNEELHVTVEITDLAGRKITAFTRKIISSGFRSIPITWNGTTSNGNSLNKGVYIYKLKIRTHSGEETSYSGKLIKVE